jgi:hypothetical protein
MLRKVPLHVIRVFITPFPLAVTALFLVPSILVEFPLVIVCAASTLAISGAADSLIRVEA